MKTGTGGTRPLGLTELAPGQDTNVARRESWQGYGTYQEAVVHLACEIWSKYGPSGTNDLSTREYGTLIYSHDGNYFYAPIMQGPAPRASDAYATVNVDAARQYVSSGSSVAFDFHTHPNIDWQTNKMDRSPLAPSGGDYYKTWGDSRPGILWGQGSRNAILYNTNANYQQLPNQSIRIW